MPNDPFTLTILLASGLMSILTRTFTEVAKSHGWVTRFKAVFHAVVSLNAAVLGWAVFQGDWRTWLGAGILTRRLGVSP